MKGKQLCNRLMNQPWLGVNLCGAVKRSYHLRPVYLIQTTKSADVVKRMVPPTVVSRYMGRMERLPVVVERGGEIIPYATMGEHPPLPPSLVVPAIIGVGISIATMVAITFGVAHAVNKEEERWRGEE
jgi:hypothetical protein